MKFIVDAQLPKALSDFLNGKGFDSIHTLDFPNKNKTKDFEIIEKAILDNRVVISKDIDFLESFILKSKPPKLIIVRTGNILNTELLKIFDNNFHTIIQMITRSNLIEVNRFEIAEHG
ncbi:MAG: DUF5615 family PIN-like protein [Chitinophagales bacterium]